MTVNIINNTMDFKIISHRGKIENSKYPLNRVIRQRNNKIINNNTR